MVTAIPEQITEERFAPQLVTVDEAGRILGVGRSKICELIYRGDLRSFTIGRARRIDVEDIRDYIEWLKAGQVD